jgi:hypothetical protein
MTTKKKSKKASSKAQPSDALLKDLKAVFEKHNWTGGAIGIHPETVMGGLGLTAEGLDCHPPKQPTEVSIHHPDGTIEKMTVCL